MRLPGSRPPVLTIGGLGLGALTIGTVAATLILSGVSHAEVVHLKSGDPLIGEIVSGEKADGSVLLETLNGTRQVPLDQVERIESADTLRATLPKARPSDWKAGLRRVESAVATGLFSDALEAADAALIAISKAKDRPSFALPPRFLDLPVAGVRAGDSLDEARAHALISLAGDPKRPAAALIARRRIHDVAASPGLATAALKLVESSAPGSREAALQAIARTVPADGLEPAIARMLLDDREDVREAARAAVAAYDHDGIAYPVSRALATDDAQVRAAAMDAAQSMKLTRTVGALVRNLRRVDSSGKTRAYLSSVTHTSYVSDFDVEIAQSAVIGQPVVKVLQHGVVQDVGIAGVFSQRIPRTERARIVNLLSALTGESFGDQPGRWNEWLEQQRKPVDAQRNLSENDAREGQGP